MTDSGFDPGLADATRSGVFFVTEEDLDGLGVAARDAGLVVRRVDLKGCNGKATVLLRIATALDFPTSFGRNWDALSDSLRDLSWVPGAGYAVLFEGAGDLRAADEGDFDTLLDILDEAAQDWAQRALPFWAFLALPEAAFEELEESVDPGE